MEQTQVEVTGDPVEAARLQRGLGKVALGIAWTADMVAVFAGQTNELGTAAWSAGLGLTSLAFAGVSFYGARNTERSANTSAGQQG